MLKTESTTAVEKAKATFRHFSVRKSYSICDLFNATASDILCNTSYPMKPLYFAGYRSNADIMDTVDSLSMYFHIPFCQHLCRFCEYTRFLSSDVHAESRYVDDLISQTEAYLESHPVKLLYGLDIGGGTPTALHINAFRQLVNYSSSLIKTLSHGADFESSMEFSFSSIDDGKIEAIADSGFHRMSTGIQIHDKDILSHNRREMHPVLRMKETLEKLHDAGIRKLNLDIMYGFQGQTELALRNTLHVIGLLSPEQVTLYEMRYNHNTLPYETISRKVLFDQYTALYDGLTTLGYHAEFGMNAFSRYDDQGVSSYLRTRMLEAKPYKGFGIAAQSMSWQGISYNILKGSRETHLPAYDRITEEDVYLLPKEEIAAKYVSVGLYSGCFSLRVLSGILGTDAERYYAEELRFLKDRQLIRELDNGICRVTREGFLYVISCCSRLQLSFSENGPWSSSEEKERVAEMDDTCYGKEIGFGSQPMKIAEASSRRLFRFFETVLKVERCFRYHAFPQDRTAIKVVVRPHCKMDQGKHTYNLHPTQEENKHGRSKKYHLGGI